MTGEQGTIPSDILDVLDHYGLEYHASGSIYVMSCLFHDDSTPSMVIYPDTNSFYCFGCGTSGTPENIVMHMENCTYQQAVKLLYGQGYEWFKLRKKQTKNVSIDLGYMYRIIGRKIKEKIRASTADKEKLDKARGLILKYSKNEVDPNKLFECLQEIKQI